MESHGLRGRDGVFQLWKTLAFQRALAPLSFELVWTRQCFIPENGAFCSIKGLNSEDRTKVFHFSGNHSHNSTLSVLFLRIEFHNTAFVLAWEYNKDEFLEKANRLRQIWVVWSQVMSVGVLKSGVRCFPLGQDQREVILLSTNHKPRMIARRKNDWKTRKVIEKPECIVHCNKYMQISFVECVRKTITWYKRFFFHLLDLSTLNAYMLFNLAIFEVKRFGNWLEDMLSPKIQWVVRLSEIIPYIWLHAIFHL